MVFDLLFYNDPKTGTTIGQTAQSLTSADALVWTLTVGSVVGAACGWPSTPHCSYRHSPR